MTGRQCCTHRGLVVPAHQSGVADRIYVLPMAEPVDLGTNPSVEVLSHRVWNQRVEIRCRVAEPCFARLAYAYYPYLRVRVDGEPITPYETADNTVVWRCGNAPAPAGNQLTGGAAHIAPTLDIRYLPGSCR